MNIFEKVFNYFTLTPDLPVTAEILHIQQPVIEPVVVVPASTSAEQAINAQEFSTGTAESPFGKYVVPSVKPIHVRKKRRPKR